MRLEFLDRGIQVGLERIVNGFLDEIAVADVGAAQDELVKFMSTRHGGVLSAIKEKKTLDDALKADLSAALKEFQVHFKSMKAPTGAR